MPDSFDNNVQLTIETTGQTGSIAVLCGENVLWQRQLDESTRTASTLAPALDEAIRWCNAESSPPSFVSVAEGPGSFTGLRIATTTAKTLAYALEIPLVAVDSLAAIAANVLLHNKDLAEVAIGLNAYRGQVFVSRFNREHLMLKDAASGNCVIPDSKVIDQEDWQTTLDSWSKEQSLRFAGDEKMFRDKLADDAIASRFIARDHPDAIGVGILGLKFANCNLFQDPLALVPKYIKLSAAEEKELANP